MMSQIQADNHCSSQCTASVPAPDAAVTTSGARLNVCEDTGGGPKGDAPSDDGQLGTFNTPTTQSNSIVSLLEKELGSSECDTTFSEAGGDDVQCSKGTAIGLDFTCEVEQTTTIANTSDNSDDGDEDDAESAWPKPLRPISLPAVPSKPSCLRKTVATAQDQAHLQVASTTAGVPFREGQDQIQAILQLDEKALSSRTQANTRRNSKSIIPMIGLKRHENPVEYAALEAELAQVPSRNPKRIAFSRQPIVFGPSTADDEERYAKLVISSPATSPDSSPSHELDYISIFREWAEQALRAKGKLNPVQTLPSRRSLRGASQRLMNLLNDSTHNQVQPPQLSPLVPSPLPTSESQESLAQVITSPTRSARRRSKIGLNETEPKEQATTTPDPSVASSQEDTNPSSAFLNVKSPTRAKRVLREAQRPPLFQQTLFHQPIPVNPPVSQSSTTDSTASASGLIETLLSESIAQAVEEDKARRDSTQEPTAVVASVGATQLSEHPSLPLGSEQAALSTPSTDATHTKMSMSECSRMDKLVHDPIFEEMLCSTTTQVETHQASQQPDPLPAIDELRIITTSAPAQAATFGEEVVAPPEVPRIASMEVSQLMPVATPQKLASRGKRATPSPLKQGSIPVPATPLSATTTPTRTRSKFSTPTQTLTTSQSSTVSPVVLSERRRRLLERAPTPAGSGRRVSLRSAFEGANEIVKPVQSRSTSGCDLFDEMLQDTMPESEKTQTTAPVLDATNGDAPLRQRLLRKFQALDVVEEVENESEESHAHHTHVAPESAPMTTFATAPQPIHIVSHARCPSSLSPSCFSKATYLGFPSSQSSELELLNQSSSSECAKQDVPVGLISPGTLRRSRRLSLLSNKNWENDSPVPSPMQTW